MWAVASIMETGSTMRIDSMMEVYNRSKIMLLYLFIICMCTIFLILHF